MCRSVSVNYTESSVPSDEVILEWISFIAGIEPDTDKIISEIPSKRYKMKYFP
jgi:hypothetical protein